MTLPFMPLIGRRGGGGFSIGRSLRFNAPDSAGLSRTFTANSNRKKWAFSAWLKLSGTAVNMEIFTAKVAGGAYPNTGLSIEAGQFRFWSYTGSAFMVNKYTTRLMRDPSAHFHLLLLVDTTLANAEDRVQFVINGVRETSFSTNTNPSQNVDFDIGTSGLTHGIGRLATGGNGFFDGIMSEVVFVDGANVTASDFGQFDSATGQWVPKRYAGSFGATGFRLDFADNSGTTATTLGADRSGNGNDWTPTGISVTAGPGNDSLTDTPTNNFCVLNRVVASGVTPSNCGLDVTTGTTSPRAALASFGVSSGKWYWEYLPTTATFCSVGISSNLSARSLWPGDDAESFGCNVANGNRLSNDSSGAGVSYGSAFNGTTDIMMVAFDADSGRIWWGRNGTWFGSGNPAAGTNAAYSSVSMSGRAWFPSIGADGVRTGSFNFGQRPFAFTPPSGFSALCTANLPDPAVRNPSRFFNTRQYTGDGSTSDRAITGVGFQADIAWFKNRGAAAHHVLISSDRAGFPSLFTSTTGAEVDEDEFVSFDADGFTIRRNATFDRINGASQAMIAWLMRKSATSGIDVVSYTGNGANRTIAHSLGRVPALIIVKRRDAGVRNWTVWHVGLGAGTQYVGLNSTAAAAADATVWNSTTPTSSVFSLGTFDGVNASGGTYVAYLFAEIPGFSRIGSYIGNGAVDGPFVWCGFRPAWTLTKRVDAGTEDWNIRDAPRSPWNVMDDVIYGNSSAAEQANNAIFNQDFLSNGFKCRSLHASQNASGATYIFVAFAEAPFKYALAR